MAADVQITVDTSGFSRALSKFLSYQKDPSRVLRRVLRFWVSFAMARVVKADASEIEMYLMAQISRSRGVRKRRASTKRKAELLGTLAAFIVARSDYPFGKESGVSMSARRARRRRQVLAEGGGKALRTYDNSFRQAFIKRVERFIARRKYAAGLHRAGMLPALKALKKSPGERLPKYRHQPGAYSEKTASNDVTLTVDNFAKVIAEIAPNAFEGSISDMERLLLKWIREDMEKAKKSAGLS